MSMPRRMRDLPAPPPPVHLRALVTALVDVTNVVDLRTATARIVLDLTSEVPYFPGGQCRRVRRLAAHRRRTRISSAGTASCRPPGAAA